MHRPAAGSGPPTAASSRCRSKRGIHGLSNAELDTPWRKVVDLKRRLQESLDTVDSVDALARDLFDALGDRSLVADASLPDTGMSKEVERQLSSAFVDMPGRGYGTRCSTLLITERGDSGDRAHVLERTYPADRNDRPRLRRTRGQRLAPKESGHRAALAVVPVGGRGRLIDVRRRASTTCAPFRRAGCRLRRRPVRGSRIRPARRTTRH